MIAQRVRTDPRSQHVPQDETLQNFQWLGVRMYSAGAMRGGRVARFTEHSGIPCKNRHSRRIALQTAQDERCKPQIYRLSTKSKQQ